MDRSRVRAHRRRIAQPPGARLVPRRTARRLHQVELRRRVCPVDLLEGVGAKAPALGLRAVDLEDRVELVELDQAARLDGASEVEKQDGVDLPRDPLVVDGGAIEPTNIYSESLSPRYHFGWSELYALSDDRYRLIRAPEDELYDLSQDPDELTSIVTFIVPAPEWEMGRDTLMLVGFTWAGSNQAEAERLVDRMRALARPDVEVVEPARVPRLETLLQLVGQGLAAAHHPHERGRAGRHQTRAFM